MQSLDGIFTLHRHTLVGFLPGEYGEDYSTLQRINQRECSENPAISETSEVVALENIIAHTTFSKGREEKRKVVHTVIR